MSWMQYHLIFKLLSNLHIGHRKVGNLMQSRGYVHGRALRGAIINCIAKNVYSGKTNPYEKSMSVVKESIRFTYLWPAIMKESSMDARWDMLHTKLPFAGIDGLDCFYPNPEKMTSERFEYMFLQSKQRTAINPNSQTAEESLLFEVESVSPRTRDADQVFLVGVLWISESAQDLEGPEEFLTGIVLGGEQSYGWGRGVPEIEPTSKTLDPDDIQFKGYVPAHLISKHLTSNSATRVEALAGYEWKGGRHCLTCSATYAPGCLLDSDNSMRIDDYGIWVQE